MIGLGLLALLAVGWAASRQAPLPWPADWTPDTVEGDRAATHYAIASLRAEEQGEPDPLRDLNRDQHRAVRQRRRELLRTLTPGELALATGASGEIEAMGPREKAQYAMRLSRALKGEGVEEPALPRSKRSVGKPGPDRKVRVNPAKRPLPPEHEVRIHPAPEAAPTSWRFADGVTPSPEE